MSPMKSLITMQNWVPDLPPQWCTRIAKWPSPQPIAASAPSVTAYGWSTSASIRDKGQVLDCVEGLG